jgi:low temperature requirement protein LtrA
MNSSTIISPEDQNVTFVELFFDLVFVFSVTQVVGLLHAELNWLVVGQVILVFWLVWWAWTQFTWTLNAADTTHHWVVLGTLAATAVAFFMAVALPDAFQDRSLWFAVTYILVRVIGLALVGWVVSQDPSQQATIRTFTVISAGGLIAVLAGGITGGTLQYWFWGLAIVLDVVAAAAGAQREGLKLHPEHFAERHGLFVIIALGETLIVAAGQVTNALWTSDLITVAVLAVVITCGLWWSYFPRAKPVLDRALESSAGAGRSTLARDVFSLAHFPMLCGVIAYAVAIEEAVAHPDQPLAFVGRVALAVGLVLFIGGMSAAIWRATDRLLLSRIILTAVTAITIIGVTGVAPLITLAIACAGIVLIVALEQQAGSLLPDVQPEVSLPSEV